jgi:CBS domain-containing protein
MTITVAAVMTRHVASVAPDECAVRVGELLTRLDIAGVPVVDTSHRVVGVISDVDLLRAVRRDVDLRRTRVSDVMLPRPPFVTPDTDLLTAAELIEEWRLPCLPVCDQGRLTGVISHGDLLRAFITGDTSAPPRHGHQSDRCGSGRPCACVSASICLTTITATTGDIR